MVELQYFEREDFDQLISWVPTREFLLQWGGPSFRYPLDIKQLRDYLEKANRSDSEILAYKVLHKESGKIIGHISLGRIERENRSARIGRVLVGEKAARGKGIGRQMIEEISKIAFEDLGMHRVSLGVFDFNQAAITCYERAGFKKEGLLRDARKIRDEYWSLWEMSMLEDEWHEKRSS
ncbi:GNAT family N-acetyltransferase [Thalassobacillus pellis]|uniref:GNAT family N-acetyltransferase n=1 Tax=Thalassobacillus pellis TaxID=748008 RepID=UPI001960A6BA|nr:GNAT family protein [Thalassobacillus pellis]MBM7553484.1 RimJ/RimL family protein N-acetyltransferase [Thalassobacillus pellis]